MAEQNQKPMCKGSPDHCPQVQQAAEDAVRKVFAILGVDVDVPKEVEEFRENLRFGASMRRAADKGVLTIIGVLATAMLAALWAGIVSKIVGHP
jgi:hypothetical protein